MIDGKSILERLKWIWNFHICFALTKGFGEDQENRGVIEINKNPLFFVLGAAAISSLASLLFSIAFLMVSHNFILSLILWLLMFIFAFITCYSFTMKESLKYTDISLMKKMFDVLSDEEKEILTTTIGEKEVLQFRDYVLVKYFFFKTEEKQRLKSERSEWDKAVTAYKNSLKRKD